MGRRERAPQEQGSLQGFPASEQAKGQVQSSKGASMLGNLLLGLVIVVVVLAIVVATRPSTFHFERSILITASPENWRG
jgi:hypothetical protein